jgi:hypothetical protein
MRSRALPEQNRVAHVQTNSLLAVRW